MEEHRAVCGVGRAESLHPRTVPQYFLRNTIDEINAKELPFRLKQEDGEVFVQVAVEGGKERRVEFFFRKLISAQKPKNKCSNKPRTVGEGRAVVAHGRGENESFNSLRGLVPEPLVAIEGDVGGKETPGGVAHEDDRELVVWIFVNDLWRKMNKMEQKEKKEKKKAKENLEDARGNILYMLWMAHTW